MKFRHGSSPERLFLAHGRPTESGRDRGLVIFPLNHVLRAALIEAEYFVGKIETVHHEAKPTMQTEAPLGVDLKVRIKIDVTEGATESA